MYAFLNACTHVLPLPISGHGPSPNSRPSGSFVASTHSHGIFNISIAAGSSTPLITSKISLIFHLVCIKITFPPTLTRDRTTDNQLSSRVVLNVSEFASVLSWQVSSIITTSAGLPLTVDIVAERQVLLMFFFSSKITSNSSLVHLLPILAPGHMSMFHSILRLFSAEAFIAKLLEYDMTMQLLPGCLNIYQLGMDCAPQVVLPV